MSSALSQADIAAIIAALRENKLDSELMSQTGVASKNDQGPTEKPTGDKTTSVPSTGTGPTPKPNQDQTLNDLSQHVQGNPRPHKDLLAANIVQMASRIAFSKDLPRQVSTYIPSAHRLYQVQHEMDSLLVQNRYFRQSIPSFLPTQSRAYIGILFIMQVARCMDEVDLLTGVADLSFFQNFFRRHPVETLPVPGPLIAILQAVNVSNPQDATLPRVSPILPNPIGPNRADALIQDAASYALPNLPMIYGLHNLLLDMVQQAQNGNANAPVNTANDILGYLGFNGSAATQYHRGGQAGALADIAINGRAFPAGFANMNADHLWSATCPGIGQPIELNEELVSAFRNNRRALTFPVLAANTPTNDLNSFVRALTGQWFSDLKRNMSIYCRYVKGSGTMQDIKVLGPSSGLHIGAASTVGIQQPTGFNDQGALLPGDASFMTTLPANDRTAELLAVFGQPHIRIQGHPHARYNNIGSDHVNRGRNGLFWETRPIRTPTVNDHITDSLAEEVALYIRERANQD